MAKFRKKPVEVEAFRLVDGLPRAVVSLNVSSVGDKMLDIETWGTVPATLDRITVLE